MEGDILNLGILDIEMTCDGKQIGNKFIDDGRMKHSKREIIAVGFIVFNDKYKILEEYKSFVRPSVNYILTDYCKNLTGITQTNVDSGKKCNDAFYDILKICKKHNVKIIMTFGNADKSGIFSSAKWCRKSKDQVQYMYVIANRILDIKPIIIESNFYNLKQKNLGLSKIADTLKIKNAGTLHNALNDSLLLLKICRKIKLKINRVNF